MVRIDVFKVEGEGYYWVPIYVADTLKPELPNRAVVAFKAYDEWKEMTDDDFVFSLYPNDLFKATHKKEIKMAKCFKESTMPDTLICKESLFYFVSAGISVASICCVTNDNTYTVKSLGIKTLESLEKYTVDVLGEYHPVRKEERQRFNKKKG